MDNYTASRRQTIKQTVYYDIRCNSKIMGVATLKDGNINLPSVNAQALSTLLPFFVYESKCNFHNAYIFLDKNLKEYLEFKKIFEDLGFAFAEVSGNTEIWSLTFY